MYDERACRRCGCTEDRACTVGLPGGDVLSGCWWVAEDLCCACAKTPLFGFFFGRDYKRPSGYLMCLTLAPAMNLMAPGETASMILVGLELRVRYWWPRVYGRRRLMWPLSFEIRSDAREISYRQAEFAGWKVR